VGVRAGDGRHHPRRRARLLRHAPRRDILQGTPHAAAALLSPLSRPVPPGKLFPRSVSLRGLLLLQARMEERLRRYEAHMLAKAKEAQQLKDEAQRDDKAQLLPDS
jgi:hypothetical protein